MPDCLKLEEEDEHHLFGDGDDSSDESGSASGDDSSDEDSDDDSGSDRDDESGSDDDDDDEDGSTNDTMGRVGKLSKGPGYIVARKPRQQKSVSKDFKVKDSISKKDTKPNTTFRGLLCMVGTLACFMLLVEFLQKEQTRPLRQQLLGYSIDAMEYKVITIGIVLIKVKSSWNRPQSHKGHKYQKVQRRIMLGSFLSVMLFGSVCTATVLQETDSSSTLIPRTQLVRMCIEFVISGVLSTHYLIPFEVQEKSSQPQVPLLFQPHLRIHVY